VSLYGQTRLTIYQLPGAPVPLPLKAFSWVGIVVFFLTPWGWGLLLWYGLSRIGLALGIVPAQSLFPPRVRDSLDVFVADGMFHWQHFHGNEVYLASTIPDVVVEVEAAEEGTIHVVSVLTPRPPLATAHVQPTEAYLQGRDGRLRIWAFGSAEEAEALRDWLRKELGLPRPEFSRELAKGPPPVEERISRSHPG
jgi:hypothetical protein